MTVPETQAAFATRPMFLGNRKGVSDLVARLQTFSSKFLEVCKSVTATAPAGHFYNVYILTEATTPNCNSPIVGSDARNLTSVCLVW